MVVPKPGYHVAGDRMLRECRADQSRQANCIESRLDAKADPGQFEIVGQPKALRSRLGHHCARSLGLHDRGDDFGVFEPGNVPGVDEGELARLKAWVKRRYEGC